MELLSLEELKNPVDVALGIWFGGGHGGAGLMLDSILEVFSNISDSMILVFCHERS